MIKIAICDDENKFISELVGFIKRYSEDSGTAICTVVYSDGDELLRKYPTDIDLLFLDIQMPKVNGLQVAETIRKTDPKVSIIFLTSMAQYALEGYKYQATNFIIKPIKYVRLKNELDRWLHLYEQEQTEYVVVSNDTGKYKVPLNRLQYVETYGRNLMVHTDDDNIVAYRKMKEFENELPESSFVRCHASYLVNLRFVKQVKKLEIELTTGACLPISQPKRKDVMVRLAKYWGDRL